MRCSLSALGLGAFLAARVAAGAAPAVEPVRVASLLPYVSEALMRIPDRVRVVASVAPELGGNLPPGVADLGSPHAPNFEIAAAARPDLVVGDARYHTAFSSALTRTGARLVLIGGSSVEATFQGLLEVAEAAGARAEMEALVASARQELLDLHLESARAVLPLFGSPGSLMAITDRTWLGDLLGQLGFRLVPDEVAGREAIPGYVEVSDEVLAVSRPELVLLVTHGSPESVAESFEREAANGGALAALAPRVKVLDPALFARNPGLELPRAAQALVALAVAAQ
jgi:iron complex transport system substrate-binding protein